MHKYHRSSPMTSKALLTSITTGVELKCVPNEKQLPPPPSIMIRPLSRATLVCLCNIRSLVLSGVWNRKIHLTVIHWNTSSCYSSVMVSAVGRALAFHCCIPCLIPGTDMWDSYGHYVEQGALSLSLMVRPYSCIEIAEPCAMWTIWLVNSCNKLLQNLSRRWRVTDHTQSTFMPLTGRKIETRKTEERPPEQKQLFLYSTGERGHN